jgi:MFS family permease
MSILHLAAETPERRKLFEVGRWLAASLIAACFAVVVATISLGRQDTAAVCALLSAAGAIPVLGGYVIAMSNPHRRFAGSFLMQAITLVGVLLGFASVAWFFAMASGWVAAVFVLFSAGTLLVYDASEQRAEREAAKPGHQ